MAEDEPGTAPPTPAEDPADWYQRLRVLADGKGHTVFLTVTPGGLKSGQEAVVVMLTESLSDLSGALQAVEDYLNGPHVQRIGEVWNRKEEAHERYKKEMLRLFQEKQDAATAWDNLVDEVKSGLLEGDPIGD
jgi:hypothetical protein